MSTIKSSAEHLTLNADGASKDIKFQANGVEKASISSAGAFTSTTIDATKLTGALPAISGAALTGVGVAGITSSADATAITIDSSENVGIGTASPSSPLHLSAVKNDGWVAQLLNTGTGSDANGVLIKAGVDDADLILRLQQADGGAILDIKHDGRGISQFTAHAWGKISCQGTPSLITGHNVSSISDRATGRYRANYTNNSNGANCVVVSGQNNNYYDEIYWADIDDCVTSRASFGCSRVSTGADWFDTYKMTFVTFTV